MNNNNNFTWQLKDLQIFLYSLSHLSFKINEQKIISISDVGYFLCAGIVSRENEEWKHQPRRGEEL